MLGRGGRAPAFKWNLQYYLALLLRIFETDKMTSKVYFLQSLLVVLMISCASIDRSTIEYNNIDYPKSNWKLPIYIKEGSDHVQVLEKLKYSQTTYYGCYNGKVRILLSNGEKQDFDIEWRSWIRPERIDLILQSNAMGKMEFNVMPKGHSEIYLSDDLTAVRLPHRTALHWSIIDSYEGEHYLIGEKPIWNLNPEMDHYPILYLTYLAARNYFNWLRSFKQAIYSVL